MYSEKELARVIELHDQIEGNKSHGYAAPTYKDSPALREISEIMLSHTEDTAEVLSEKIPAFWYLANCYDEMCRWGVSVKYYKLLLEAYVKLIELGELPVEDEETFEDAIYSTVKARNQFVPDQCEDIVELVKGTLHNDKLEELRCSAIDSRKGMIKNDPVELTEEYLAVIDEVEERIDKNKVVGICHECWSLKADYLSEYGIRWMSPAFLNPGVMFD